MRNLTVGLHTIISLVGADDVFIGLKLRTQVFGGLIAQIGVLLQPTQAGIRSLDTEVETPGEVAAKTHQRPSIYAPKNEGATQRGVYACAIHVRDYRGHAPTTFSTVPIV